MRRTFLFFALSCAFLLFVPFDTFGQTSGGGGSNSGGGNSGDNSGRGTGGSSSTGGGSGPGDLGASMEGSNFQTGFDGIDSDTSANGSFIGRGDGSAFIGRDVGTSATGARGIPGRTTTRSSTRRSSSRSGASRTGSSRSSYGGSSVAGVSSSGRTVSRPGASFDTNENEEFSLEYETGMASAFQSRIARFSTLSRHPVPVSAALAPHVEGWSATLSGTVKTPGERLVMEQLALLEPGVQEVRNDILVHSELAQPKVDTPRTGPPRTGSTRSEATRSGVLFPAQPLKAPLPPKPASGSDTDSETLPDM